MQGAAQTARASISTVAESRVMQDAVAAASAAKGRTRASIVALTESDAAKEAAAVYSKASADASKGFQQVGAGISNFVNPLVDRAAASSIGQKVNAAATNVVAKGGSVCLVTIQSTTLSQWIVDESSWLRPAHTSSGTYRHPRLSRR